ncbi:unnamed protein product [Phytomonas sp. EM1]|nr:unnamed protein product [Phytomonas sp. EM1]|eukprot:CCW63166.1 unnamed protein product [Phytomonas sp. isolate EM1]
MTRSIAFRGIDKLCRRLIACKANNALVEKVIGEGIRQRVVDADSLPLIAQRLSTTHGEWVLALEVLASERLDRHGIRRDDNIWKIIESGVPDAMESKAAAAASLRKIYGRKIASLNYPERGK